MQAGRINGVAARWHLVTGEYPPDSGGVADYAEAAAGALADTGARLPMRPAHYNGLHTNSAQNGRWSRCEKLMNKPL
jgi:hypothetical protein